MNLGQESVKRLFFHFPSEKILILFKHWYLGRTELGRKVVVCCKDAGVLKVVRDTTKVEMSVL